MLGIGSALIGIAGAAINIGRSAKAKKQAAREMKEIQDKIDSYERQVLTNTLAGVDTPYQVYELATRQVRQRTADVAGAAAEAGARGMALLPQIQQNDFEQQERVNADLEQNLYQLKLAQAQEEQRIQRMTEQREREELAGLGKQFEAYRQTAASADDSMWKGVGSMIKGVGGVLSPVIDTGVQGMIAKGLQEKGQLTDELKAKLGDPEQSFGVRLINNITGVQPKPQLSNEELEYLKGLYLNQQGSSVNNYGK